MWYRSNQRILTRRISNDYKTLKEMFNIISHQGNMNQNDSESILPIRVAKIKNTDDSLCWKGCGVRETSIAGGSTNLYNYSENQYGGFSENWESIYLKTHQYYYRAYRQRIYTHTKRTFVQPCS